MAKLKPLVGLGFFLRRYGLYLVRNTVHQLYHTYLLNRRPASGQLHCHVSINLEEYFRDCIRRMAEQDIDYLRTRVNPVHPTTIDEKNSNDDNDPTGVNLVDTTDIHSKIVCSIAQRYLRVVLDSSQRRRKHSSMCTQSRDMNLRARSRSSCSIHSLSNCDDHRSRYKYSTECRTERPRF